MGTIPQIKEYVNLRSYGDREAAWDNHKASADRVAKLYETYSDCDRDLRKSERISDCAGFLRFGWYHNPNTNKNEIHLVEAHYCHCRACSVCAWRRSLMLKAKFYMNMPEIIAQYPKVKFIFLTLTLRNCQLSEIRDTVNNMAKAWKRFFQRKQFKNDVLGFVRNLEITRGVNDTCHPHYHILIAVKSTYFSTGHYISKDMFAQLWKESLRLDYIPVVDVRTIRGAIDRSAVSELLKYSVKELDIGNDIWYKSLMDSLHHIRAISTSGILKDVVKTPKEETDDQLTFVGDSQDMTPLNKVVDYKWNKPIKRYRKV